MIAQKENLEKGVNLARWEDKTIREAAVPNLIQFSQLLGELSYFRDQGWC